MTTLFACTVQDPLSTPAPKSSLSPTLHPSRSSSASTRPELEYGDAEAASSGSAPSLSMVPERLLDSGLLEVGNADAPLVLLGLTHHSCAYCREFFQTVFPRLLSEEIATGKLRYQIALLPIRKYPESDMQARGLFCAAKQGKGLLMHQMLFERGATDEATLLLRARELHLEKKEFRACLEANATQLVMAGEASLPASLGVTVVPTFFLNGEKSIGLPTYADMRGRIGEALAKGNH
ncbi:thioredoxin domain-containing protein [Candidatus Peregrinibacteria bacterium]|nr:thioredoxin domain-containing protein [Candidatus Peregrinibacteria bacterium]MBI3816771.1 thioredoxin domain-containing protein [Candidatus Peregrinibacteria bacterium]